MVITRQALAERIAAYLRHQISLNELVDWAENALMDADFEESDFEAIRTALGRLGVADVRAFGLLWEDCEAILRQLGFTVDVQIIAA